MKKTEINHDNNQISDNIYELGFYDKKGYFNTKKIIGHYLIFFLIFFFICFNSLIYFHLTYNFNYSKGLDFTYFLNVKEWIIDNIFYNKSYTNDFIFMMFISLIFPFIYIFLHFKNLLFKSEIQSKMASVNLNQYYLKSKKGNVYNWKLIKGQTRNAEGFQSKKKDICQLFDVENINIFRNGKNGNILMETLSNFPTIEKLKEYKINIKDYLLDNHLFLGFTNIKDEVQDIKKISMGKKMNDYYRCYLPLEKILIHIAIAGRPGSGKSNNFASFLNSFLTNMDTIDTLIIHDFKGIETEQINNKLLSKTKNFDGRIFTSTSMTELEEILQKLEIIYYYRQQVMTKKTGINNYDGGKIFLLIDEMNYGFKGKLASKIPEIRKQAEQVEMMIDLAVKLYRAMGIYVIGCGQSLVVGSDFNQGLRNGSGIKFLLRNQGGADVSRRGSRYEQGEDISTYSKGQTLYLNSENSTFMKFMPRFIGTNFYDDFINYIPKERQQIDKDLYKYLDNLEYYILQNRRFEAENINKLREDNKKIDIDDFLKTYERNLKTAIDELKNGIFIKKNDNNINIFDDKTIEKAKELKQNKIENNENKKEINEDKNETKKNKYSDEEIEKILNS